MELTGLHILLTYQCTFECDHCFAWGSPFQNGVMTKKDLDLVLEQAGEIKSMRWIYFEGGEPFLYYPLLVYGVRKAAGMGFKVGIVSNAYWATSMEDARLWLEPLASLVEDLSVSSDLFHYKEKLSQQACSASQAAQELDMPVGTISIASPEPNLDQQTVGKLPEGESGVMYRGRAVEKLAGSAEKYSWQKFTECPHEDLRDPGRVHVDPLGNLHICQGISIGNLFQKRLKLICAQFNPEKYPVLKALLAGGPAELARRNGLVPLDKFADACHLCYQTRLELRPRYPECLRPDQMYGLMS